MIPRTLEATINERLEQSAAVALLGPRQSGKSTLARKIGEARNAVILDLQDVEDQLLLNQPVSFLQRHDDRLVVLDEIHRRPGLFPVLRGVIDRGRRKGKGIGRFLILGPASLPLLKQAGESLAGRLLPVEMTPFTALEIERDRASADRLWLRGGTPPSFLSESDDDSLVERASLVSLCLGVDVPAFGSEIPATTLYSFLQTLAHRQGQELNSSDLGRSMKVKGQTASRYLDLLTDMFLVRQLQPYHRNFGKRIIKRPKVYIRDSGMLHRLLNISTMNDLLANSICGFSWEGFVIENLLSSLKLGSAGMFYRTVGGEEVDLVIEHGGHELWAVEIKRSRGSPTKRGFRRAVESLKPARSFIVYDGSERIRLDGTTEVIPLVDLMAELRSV